MTTTTELLMKELRKSIKVGVPTKELVGLFNEIDEVYAENEILRQQLMSIESYYQWDEEV